MNVPFIFSSGIFVIVLLLIGLIYTFVEFREMSRHPEDFRKPEDKPKVKE